MKSITLERSTKLDAMVVYDLVVTDQPGIRTATFFEDTEFLGRSLSAETTWLNHLRGLATEVFIKTDAGTVSLANYLNGEAAEGVFADENPDDLAWFLSTRMAEKSFDQTVTDLAKREYYGSNPIRDMPTVEIVDENIGYFDEFNDSENLAFNTFKRWLEVKNARK